METIAFLCLYHPASNEIQDDMKINNKNPTDESQSSTPENETST